MRSWAGLFGVCVAAVLLQGAVARAAGEATMRTGVVVVREGETLWSIARRITPEGADARATVERLRLENGLDRSAAVGSGDELTLGVGKPVASGG